MTNGGHLYFNHTEELLILPMTFHVNELSMANILSFAEVSNIAGVNIKMYTSKQKVINVHIKDREIFI